MFRIISSSKLRKLKNLAEHFEAEADTYFKKYYDTHSRWISARRDLNSQILALEALKAQYEKAIQARTLLQEVANLPLTKAKNPQLPRMRVGLWRRIHELLGNDTL